MYYYLKLKASSRRRVYIVKNAPFYCYSVQKYEIVLKNANLLTKIFLCGTKKAHKYA